MIAVNQSRQICRQSRRFVLKHVGENLYRSPCGNYLAVLKVHGRQVRRSLRTDDRQLAKHRLEEFRLQSRRQQPAAAKIVDLADCRFVELAERWFGATKMDVKPTGWERRGYAIKSLEKFFKRKPVGAITKMDVENRAIAKARTVSPVQAGDGEKHDALRPALIAGTARGSCP